MDLKHKNIVITGAASGIGKALVDLFRTIPCRLIAADISYPSANMIANDVYQFPCDVGEIHQQEALFDFAIKTLGRIDIFVANAGFAYYGKTTTYAGKPPLEKIFSVNALAPCFAAIKMKELYPSGDFRVVITASAMAHWPLPGYALYAATKASLHGFASAFRYELNVGQNIQLIYPIGTRTAFFATASNSPKPLLTQSSQKVAHATLQGIKTNRNEIYPSRLFHFLLLLGRVFPFIKSIVLYIEYRNFKHWCEINAQG